MTFWRTRAFSPGRLPTSSPRARHVSSPRELNRAVSDVQRDIVDIIYIVEPIKIAGSLVFTGLKRRVAVIGVGNGSLEMASHDPGFPVFKTNLGVASITNGADLDIIFRSALIIENLKIGQYDTSDPKYASSLFDGDSGMGKVIMRDCYCAVYDGYATSSDSWWYQSSFINNTILSSGANFTGGFFRSRFIGNHLDACDFVPSTTDPLGVGTSAGNTNVLVGNFGAGGGFDVNTSATGGNNVIIGNMDVNVAGAHASDLYQTATDSDPLNIA